MFVFVPMAALDDDVIGAAVIDVDDEPFDGAQLLARRIGNVDTHEVERASIHLASVHEFQPGTWMIHVLLRTGFEQKTGLPRYDQRMTSSVGTAPAPQLRDRTSISDRFKWNLTDIFSDWTAWQAAFEDLDRKIGEYAALQGTLA